MKKLLIISSLFFVMHITKTMEKWNTAHNKMNSITPQTSDEKRNKILDDVHENLSQFNELYRENPHRVLSNNNNNRSAQTAPHDPESEAISNEFTKLHQEAEKVVAMAEGRDKDRKLDELEKRHQKLKKRRQQWEEKNNLKPLPSQANNTNRKNNHESPPQETIEQKDSFSLREFVQSTMTNFPDPSLDAEKRDAENHELYEKILAKSKKLNNGLNPKKALLIAGASCTALSGWIAYKNKNRFIEYCNRINTKKAAKTIFYLGCGSAVFVAGLYGYKKIANVFNTPIKKNEEPKIIYVQSDIDDTPRYQERAQEIRDKYNIPKRQRTNNRPTHSSFLQETKEELAADISHLKNTTRDTIEAAPELIKEIGNDISTGIKKGWRSFTKWLNSKD